MIFALWPRTFGVRRPSFDFEYAFLPFERCADAYSETSTQKIATAMNFEKRIEGKYTLFEILQDALAPLLGGQTTQQTPCIASCGVENKNLLSRAVDHDFQLP
jgi:hypothetical protein